MTVLKIEDISFSKDLVNRRRLHKVENEASLEADIKNLIREIRAEGNAALIRLTKNLTVSISPRKVSKSQRGKC
ncbi:MAG: hypothetical protein V1915_04825 [Candidatus Bathyarchaeota archaeon]